MPSQDEMQRIQQMQDLTSFFAEFKNEANKSKVFDELVKNSPAQAKDIPYALDQLKSEKSITVNEIKEALDKVRPSTGMLDFRTNHIKRNAWQLLFNLYNDRHTAKLSTHCAPCFAKVHIFAYNLVRQKVC